MTRSITNTELREEMRNMPYSGSIDSQIQDAICKWFQKNFEIIPKKPTGDLDQSYQAALNTAQVLIQNQANLLRKCEQYVITTQDGLNDIRNGIKSCLVGLERNT